MIPDGSVRVLIVDDDFHVAGLHQQLVDQLAGFTTIGVTGTVREAAARIAALQPDLLLLDLYLPDRNGLELLRSTDTDCFVISAATDGATQRRALRAGALGYLVKPFPTSMLVDRLQAYARFRNILTEDGTHDQEALERAFRVLHSGDARGLVRSRSATEQAVLDALDSGPAEFSALDVAGIVGVSRATAQRYLAGLAETGSIRVQLRYGSTGRPEHRYARITDR